MKKKREINEIKITRIQDQGKFDLSEEKRMINSILKKEIEDFKLSYEEKKERGRQLTDNKREELMK